MGFVFSSQQEMDYEALNAKIAISLMDILSKRIQKQNYVRKEARWEEATTAFVERTADRSAYF